MLWPLIYCPVFQPRRMVIVTFWS